MSHIRIKIIGISLLLLSSCFQWANAQDFSYSTPLVAARSNDIGFIHVERVGDSLDVTYEITDSTWFMTKSYLHVANNANGFPTLGSGVPDIQQFTYQTNHDEARVYKYDNIDVTGQPYVYVSANANVAQASTCKTDISIINSSIPTGKVLQTVSFSGNPAYFQMRVIDVTTGNTIFSGVYLGNCVDLENPISQRVRYFPKLVSSYDTDQALLACIVDRPENLPIINYLINQDYQTKFGAGANEIQAAVWTLIDDDNPVNGNQGFSFNEAIVDQVVADASAKGVGFIPGCDQFFLVLLDQGCKDALSNNQTPNVAVQQSVMWLPVENLPISHKTSLGECANAWGEGTKFSHVGWSQFFEAK
ncbi:MAG: hypothetical protein JXQ87_01755 [Bacteroidia bacterium]